MDALAETSEESRTTPLHARIAKILLESIGAGKYPVGSLLPTENDLAIELGVSRQTVRRAIEALKQRGLVSSQRGVGTRIENDRVTRRFSYSTQSVNDLFNLAAGTRLQLVSRTGFIAEGAFARTLGVPVGSRWVHLGCVRYALDEERPFCWTDVYIDARFQDIVPTQTSIVGPLFPLIEERTGTSISQIQQQIRAVALTQATSERIEAVPGSLALEIARRYVFGTEVCEVSINTLPADRFSYSVDISIQ
ncbi:GntR family transcriptional regulator [Tabrizicola sp. BL-A-41-H6]|uniref:GntR family transcriptional regulator n=1 Tax=Tabrizicola sp. BL-A-41-H6 TaxID=3421107 RepID=UPI003D66C211